MEIPPKIMVDEIEKVIKAFRHCINTHASQISLLEGSIIKIKRICVMLSLSISILTIVIIYLVFFQ